MDIKWVTLLMGEMKIFKGSELVKTTLGSCVGIVLYSPTHNALGFVHIVLDVSKDRKVEETARYADTAIPALIEKLQGLGIPKNALKAKVAGGANMFSQIPQAALPKIGEKNIQKVREILSDLRIPITGEDLGGTFGRQMWVDVGQKTVKISRIGGEQLEI